MDAKNSFKICTKCGFEWKTRDDFLKDDNISIIGYQVNFEVLTAGIFLFNHSCEGTLSLAVSEFEDLYDGPVYQERVTGSDECPEHCLREDELGPCPNKCECVFVREIIQILKK